jgi:hypothetical protein
MSRDRNYSCAECKREYDGYACKNVHRGQIWVMVCPKGHEVKLIPQTKDPCPLCKESHWNRDRNKLCGNCLLEIERLRKFEQDTIKARDPMKLFWVNTYPSFFNDESHFDEGRALPDRFTELVFLLGQPAPTDICQDRYKYPLLPKPEGRNHSDLAADRLLSFKPEVADAIQKLYERIEINLGLTHSDGVNEGKNILLQLARGEMSVKELQAEDMKHARKIQKKRR